MSAPLEDQEMLKTTTKLAIIVEYERNDTKQGFFFQFADWDEALKHARWVADSPELTLLKLEWIASQ